MSRLHDQFFDLIIEESEEKKHESIKSSLWRKLKPISEIITNQPTNKQKTQPKKQANKQINNGDSVVCFIKIISWTVL